MKSFLSWAFCVFISMPAWAQRLQWSLPQRVSDRAYITECVGSNASGLYVIKKNNRGQERDIVVEHYSEDMRHVTNKVFLTHRNEYFVKLVLDTAGLKMFYATTDKDKQKTDVKMKNITFALAEEGKDSTLFSFAGGNPGDALLTAYKVRLNPCVLFTYTLEKGDYANTYEYVMLDKDYNRQYSGTFTTGGNGAKSSIEQITFSNSSYALLVREDVKKATTKQGYQFYIFDGRFGDVDMHRSELFNDSFAITEGILKTDTKNGQMIFGGLYATKDSTYVKGYFTWKKNLKTSFISSGFRRFSPQIVAEMEGRRNKLQGIFNLRTGDIALRSDGGMILSCEEYQETHENVTDINAYGVAQPNIRNFYYYQNMLVLSISPDNNLDWHTVIHKDQVTVNDNGTFSSYLLSVTPERMLFVYNDLSRKNWNLSVTELDDKGVPNNRILVKTQDYDGRLIPQYGDQVDYNQFIIPGITPRGIVLLKVTY